MMALCNNFSCARFFPLGPSLVPHGDIHGTSGFLMTFPHSLMRNSKSDVHKVDSFIHFSSLHFFSCAFGKTFFSTARFTAKNDSWLRYAQHFQSK
jgi:hypothetical protein